MKRADGPVAPRFVRVTPEQYAAFAAEYQGNVKLFRLDESEIAVNAGLLGELLETAATALRTNESVRVKYYTGISHSLHGVMVQGSSRDPSVPPPRGVYYHEFHEDNAGRVRAVVGNDTDGSRYLTDVLLYDLGRPYARLYYNRAGEFQQAIMVYHRGDQPYLTCRVGRGGDIWSWRRTRPLSCRSVDKAHGVCADAPITFDDLRAADSPARAREGLGLTDCMCSLSRLSHRTNQSEI